MILSATCIQKQSTATNVQRSPAFNDLTTSTIYRKVATSTISLLFAIFAQAATDPVQKNSDTHENVVVIRCSNPDQAANPDCPHPSDKRPQKLKADSVTQNIQSHGARSRITAAGPGTKQQNLVMYSGEAVVLEIGPTDRVAVGNGKIALTTVLDKHRLLIIAQDVGDTNIILWDKTRITREISLRVTAQNLNRVMSEVANLLSTVQGISVKNVGDRIFIEGKDLTEEEKGKVKALADQYPGIVDRTSGKYQISQVPDPSSMVMLDLYFVEFKKSYLQNLGVDWQRSFNGFNFGVYGESTGGSLLLRPQPQDSAQNSYFPSLPRAPISGLSTAANVAINLSSVINLAVDSGNAILLASPKISARSGGKAKFTAGGEIPLPSVSQQGTNVTFKQYGVLLEVEPQVNGDGTISGIVKAEVSSIDPAVSVMGIPAFLTRRTEADFFSHNGQAVVLSGLYSQELSDSGNKVPLLGDVPIAGSLFSNNSEIRRNTELVVFIVPHLYSPDSELNKRVLENTRTMTEQQSYELNGGGKDILPKLKAKPNLWSQDLLGDEKLGRDPNSKPEPIIENKKPVQPTQDFRQQYVN